VDQVLKKKKLQVKFFPGFCLTEREEADRAGWRAGPSGEGREEGKREREGELGRGWSAREKREKERGCGFKILNLILLYGCGSVINIITICYIFV